MINGQTNPSFFVKLENDKFDVNINTLPLKISTSSANKILFVGNWANTVRKRNVDGVDYSIIDFTNDMTQTLKKLRLHKNDADEFRQISPANTRLNWKMFDHVIDEAEMLIMRFIWSTCLKDKNLLKALGALRDVYFLNRGDLYLNLFHEMERT